MLGRGAKGEHVFHKASTFLGGIVVHSEPQSLTRSCDSNKCRPVEAADGLLAAAARPHFILRPERARPWYAERMTSLSSPARLWSRARPLRRSVLGRLTDRLRTKPAVVPAGRVLTVLSCRGTAFSCGVAADFVELQLIARATHVVCAQPLPLARHSTRAPAAHLPTVNVRFAAARHRRPGRHHHHGCRRGCGRLLRRRLLFSIILCSLALSSCCRGSLKGGMERQGGGQGGCCRATAQQQSSHGSDGPPARFQQLRRRFYARQLHAFSTRGLLKKMCTCERSFLALPACLRAGKHATRTPEARATRRYAACVLGPRTQNTIIPPN